jgi:hypothetical protein
MRPTDKKAFSLLIAGVYAYHRQTCSDALIAMYWRGCQRWDIEQVTQAVDQLTHDPEAGKFPPKIGDLTRALEGTHADRAALAWGKVHEAIGAIGAYQDVVFDDAAIHAVLEDLGGWPKVCRTEGKEMGFLQHRFCEAHRAYTGRPTFAYPRRLMGDRSPDHEWEKKALKPPRPSLVGDPMRCREVYKGGQLAGKALITHAVSLATPLLAVPHETEVQS